jgi:hypothetical protein
MVLHKCSEFETLSAGICFEAFQSNCFWVFYLLVFYLTCVCTGDGGSILLLQSKAYCCCQQICNWIILVRCGDVATFLPLFR